MNKIPILVLCIVVTIWFGSFFSSNVSASGTLVILMRDPPSGWGPATAVYISFSDIMIHRADAGDESGWFNTGVSVANLSLQEIVIFNTMIGETTLQVGKYNIIRFNITQAIATVNGQNYNCVVKSGKLHVPIIRGGVRVNPAKISSLEIDITPKITGKNGNYSLTPTVKAAPS
jgi:hypothetical protein